MHELKGPAVMGAERKHCRVLTRAVVVKGCGRIPRFLQFLRRVTVGWLVDAALEMHLTGTYLIQDGADGRNLKVLAVEGPAHHCQFGGSEMYLSAAPVAIWAGLGGAWHSFAGKG